MDITVKCEFLFLKEINTLYDLSLMWIKNNQYVIEEKYENKSIRFRQLRSQGAKGDFPKSSWIRLNKGNMNDEVRVEIVIPHPNFDLLEPGYPYYVNDMILDFYNALGGEPTRPVLQEIYPKDVLKKILIDIKVWSVCWLVLYSIPIVYSFFELTQGNNRFLFFTALIIYPIYRDFKGRYINYKRFSNIFNRYD